MRKFTVRRILSLIALSSLFAFAAPAQAAAKVVPVKASEQSFCIADPVVRATGTPPGRAADCPAGYANKGGACTREAESRPAASIAAECPAGYKVDGSSCERPAQTKPNPGARPADCPEGYTNSGSACFRLSAPDPLPASRMTCKAGETKIDTHCYKACEAGTTNSGANCVRPASTLAADKMSCKAGYIKDEKKPRCMAQCAPGFNNTGDACVRPAETLAAESLTCKTGETRQGSRCVPSAVSCAKGEVLQGGSCFAACPAGFDGVGGACWPQPPKAWVACGTGAAKDADSCAAAKFDPVALVKQQAVALGRDANVPPAAGQQVMRLVALHSKFNALLEAYVSAKDTPQFKRDLAAWTQANQNKDSFTPLDTTGAPVTEPGMLRHAVQLAAIAGFAGAEAPAYPKCSTIK
ncbi:MAG: hypothetical protein ACJ8GW_01655 [Massilia sp.]